MCLKYQQFTGMVVHNSVWTRGIIIHGAIEVGGNPAEAKRIIEIAQGYLGKKKWEYELQRFQVMHSRGPV